MFSTHLILNAAMDRLGVVTLTLLLLFKSIFAQENVTTTIPVTQNFEASCVKKFVKSCTPETTFQEDLRMSGDKIPLYISSFYEGQDNGAWDGSGCIPAAEMAFDDINARTDILPQYELRPIWNDTKVSKVLIFI